MNSFTLKAPAKINLLLAVSSSVIEGKHQLISIFSTISLSDRLTYSYDSDRGRQITIDVINAPGITPLDITVEQNIVYKAVIALEENLQTKPEGHLGITLEKMIPHEGGLGGGSSDAATTLLALCKLWGIEDPHHAAPVLSAAKSLGADVPFFLTGGCALMGGYGDQLQQTLPQPQLDLVLVKPAAGVSTGSAYAQFDADPQPMPPSELLVNMLKAKDTPSKTLASQLSNNLSKAACSLLPELAILLQELSARDGVYRALIAGSGSTVFGVCESQDAAEKTAVHFRENGYWAVAATTV